MDLIPYVLTYAAGCISGVVGLFAYAIWRQHRQYKG